MPACTIHPCITKDTQFCASNLGGHFLNWHGHLLAKCKYLGTRVACKYLVTLREFVSVAI